MSISTIKEVNISLLIAVPVPFHNSIVGRLIEEFLIVDHYPSCGLYALRRKVKVRTIHITLSSGNASVFRCEVIGLIPFRIPSADQISSSVQIITGIIEIYPALLHLPVAVKTHISVMLNKSIRNNQIAVVLELIVHIHSSRKSVDLT